jgi:hypothetical protein
VSTSVSHLMVTFAEQLAARMTVGVFSLYDSVHQTLSTKPPNGGARRPW